MKTILFLGAAVFQLPPIEYAASRGYRILTCDNRPDNPGHTLAQKSFNVSTTNLEAVLDLARSEKIDAVLSYASDVSMPTVAFVAKSLGLPGPLDEAVRILTHKGHFRRFLSERSLQNGIQYRSFKKQECDQVVGFARSLGFPLMVKPVDASGSRGVFKVIADAELDDAITQALAQSRSEEIIVESFFKKKGSQICGNGLFSHGQVRLAQLGDGHFYEDSRWMAPWGESFPPSHGPKVLLRLKKEIEAILNALNYGAGLFNVDAQVDAEGGVFVIEIAPRNGGNFMDEAINLGSGIDLAAIAVECALGHDIPAELSKAENKHFYACFMAHSLESGSLDGVRMDTSIQENLVRYVPYLAKGARVSPFTQGGNAVGNAIFRFESIEDMREKMKRMPSLCQVVLSEHQEVS